MDGKRGVWVPYEEKLLPNWWKRGNYTGRKKPPVGRAGGCRKSYTRNTGAVTTSPVPAARSRPLLLGVAAAAAVAAHLAPAGGGV